ncbi:MULTISPECIES: hypothetical protein [unclassified Sedimentibacter]|uniref:hypothetical protein n=1 Tax=unclassified Sedimentibacter TaxID=2649220 RepID=UPI0027DEB4F9|nr:hypothetical protein [Sedimentibacter sp. MB35-C1]WMJ77551.1 hypothetical protein RBQ61_01075 [Sedimentibacter sp. MB35-C1]
MSLGKNVTQANVYRKVSNLSKPFWGLTKNRIDQLDKEGYDYYVRLDYPAGSIVLTSDQVKTLVSKKVVAKDGDYKITLSDFR